jgi:hypothetical protein
MSSCPCAKLIKHNAMNMYTYIEDSFTLWPIYPQLCPRLTHPTNKWPNQNKPWEPHELDKSSEKQTWYIPLIKPVYTILGVKCCVLILKHCCHKILHLDWLKESYLWQMNQDYRIFMTTLTICQSLETSVLCSYTKSHLSISQGSSTVTEVRRIKL